jgi:hypothetical protein
MESVWIFDDRYRSKKGRPNRTVYRLPAGLTVATGHPATGRSTDNDRSTGKSAGLKRFPIIILSLDSDKWGT